MSIRLLLITFGFSLLITNSSFAWVLDRAEHKLRSIEEYLGYDLGLTLVTSKHVENAIASYPFIAVNPSWLKRLSDEEVLAVMAHEVAHIENAHFSKRMAIAAGGFFNALFDFKNKKNLRERYSGFLNYYSLEQEMNADCVAYNWLKGMRNLGYKAKPQSLATVFEKDLGALEKFEEYGLQNEPVYIRYKKVMKGHPDECL